MAFCPKCGATLEAGNNFCTACGSGVAATTMSSAASSSGAGISSNVAALLCYVFGFISGIIFLVIDPYKRDPFVRFHAFQAIFFNLGIIVFWMAWGVLEAMLSFITHGALMLILIPVNLVLGFGVFALWIVLMIKAFNNQRYMLPIVGPLAEKQANSASF